MPASSSLALGHQALSELLASRPAWPTTTAPTPEVMAALGYAQSSAGISRLRERHASAWRQHGNSNQQLLRRAAELTDGAHATVLGAGKLYDIPLQELVERFERVTLVDVDGAALAESVEQACLPEELRRRVELVTADVTGINAAFLERLNDAASSPDEPATHDALLELLYSYRLASPPSLGSGSCDVALSSMLLSQLAAPLTGLIERRFGERFPGSVRLQAPGFQGALAQFTHRVQQDHVQALLATAPLVALTCDVSEQFLQLRGTGKSVSISPEVPLIGAPHLEDLFAARQARIVESRTWTWQRIPLSAKSPLGRKLRVTGTIAARL